MLIHKHWSCFWSILWASQSCNEHHIRVEFHHRKPAHQIPTPGGWIQLHFCCLCWPHWQEAQESQRQESMTSSTKVVDWSSWIKSLGVGQLFCVFCDLIANRTLHLWLSYPAGCYCAASALGKSHRPNRFSQIFAVNWGKGTGPTDFVKILSCHHWVHMEHCPIIHDIVVVILWKYSPVLKLPIKGLMPRPYMSLHCKVLLQVTGGVGALDLVGMYNVLFVSLHLCWYCYIYPQGKAHLSRLNSTQEWWCQSSSGALTFPWICGMQRCSPLLWPPSDGSKNWCRWLSWCSHCLRCGHPTCSRRWSGVAVAMVRGRGSWDVNGKCRQWHHKNTYHIVRELSNALWKIPHPFLHGLGVDCTRRRH